MFEWTADVGLVALRQAGFEGRFYFTSSRMSQHGAGGSSACAGRMARSCSSRLALIVAALARAAGHEDRSRADAAVARRA